jgi:hypothetical protein
MISRCANPECCAPFLYLRDGRLFAVHHAHEGEVPTIEYFWLCSQCSTFLKMELSSDGAMILVREERAA